MTKGRSPNVAGSVHQRLLNQARETGRPFNELLQHYALERFLYRLSQSTHVKRFILKGALLLRVWEAPSVRPTKDIDLLGRTSNEPESLVAIVREICHQTVEPDGLEFDPQTVTGHVIVEGTDYEGVRLRFRGRLGNARITMQIDVGFGDVVTPEPSEVEYPTLLDLPAAKLLAYPPETAVAEKFEVMLRRGLLNSRMRDYYDVWLLSRTFEFDGDLLSEAIRRTCARRGTEIVAEPVGLSEAFAREAATQVQWRAFRRKSLLSQAPEELRDVVTAVEEFLRPVARALAQEKGFAGSWERAGPWKTG